MSTQDAPPPVPKKPIPTEERQLPHKPKKSKPRKVEKRQPRKR